MAILTEIKADSDVSTYELFSQQLEGITRRDAVALFLFQGDGWCPDCVPSKQALEDLAAEYHGNVEFYSIHVGTKEMWKHIDLSGKTATRTNPFISSRPFLQYIPTAIIYEGSSDKKIAIEKNKLVLPESKDFAVHREVLEGMLYIQENY